eukprot:1136123-Pelagomonas_calceolata.AAC.2
MIEGLRMLASMLTWCCLLLLQSFYPGQPQEVGGNGAQQVVTKVLVSNPIAGSVSLGLHLEGIGVEHWCGRRVRLARGSDIDAEANSQASLPFQILPDWYGGWLRGGGFDCHMCGFLESLCAQESIQAADV